MSTSTSNSRSSATVITAISLLVIVLALLQRFIENVLNLLDGLSIHIGLCFWLRRLVVVSEARSLRIAPSTRDNVEHLLLFFWVLIKVHEYRQELSEHSATTTDATVIQNSSHRLPVH